jgi:hypothetical protein
MVRRTRRRKCKHCGKLFTPDPRNATRQRYCSHPSSSSSSMAGGEFCGRRSGANIKTLSIIVFYKYRGRGFPALYDHNPAAIMIIETRVDVCNS